VGRSESLTLKKRSNDPPIQRELKTQAFLNPISGKQKEGEPGKKGDWYFPLPEESGKEKEKEEGREEIFPPVWQKNRVAR